MAEAEAGAASTTADQPKGLAIASMVLGIVSIPFMCVPYVALPCAVLAIILSLIAKGKIKRGEAGGKAMTTAGLICGVIGIILPILFILGALALLGLAGPQMMDEIQKQMEPQQQQQGRFMGDTINLVLSSVPTCAAST